MNKCTKLKGLRCPAPSMVGGSVHCMLPAVYKCNSHLYICKSHLYMEGSIQRAEPPTIEGAGHGMSVNFVH